MPDLPPDAHDDYFHPPSIPTEVCCLHCQRTYDSYLIEWRESESPGSALTGKWCCPTPGCNGAGFGFDIHPIEPGYIDPDGRDLGGWCYDDCDDDDCTGDEDTCCCDCCLMGRGEYEDEFDDDCEYVSSGLICDGPAMPQPFVPLDDLLPVNEAIGDYAVSWETMIEIEEKLGFRPPRDVPADSRTPPPSRHPPISEDDIPF